MARHIQSAAESGWDFSSRWTNTTEKVDVMANLRTSEWIPVDLNAIMTNNFKRMAEMDSLKSEYWLERYENMVANMEETLYNAAFESYFDFNHVTGRHSERYYSSNFVPLYLKDYPEYVSPDDRDEKLMNYLENKGVLGR